MTVPDLKGIETNAAYEGVDIAYPNMTVPDLKGIETSDISDAGSAIISLI